MVDPRSSLTVIAKGLPASPGAAIGEAVFDADDAEALAKKGTGDPGAPQTSRRIYGIVAAQACDCSWRHDQPRRYRGARHKTCGRAGASIVDPAM
jgi:hypothetical protein